MVFSRLVFAGQYNNSNIPDAFRLYVCFDGTKVKLGFWPGVRVRHVATKQSFAETVGGANGRLVALAGTHPLGH